MRIDLSRLDAHSADSAGRERTVDHPAHDLLSGLLETVVVPWLSSAPLAMWTCRARVRDEWVDVAEFPWARGRGIGFQLLIADETIERLLTPGATAFEIVGLPSFG